MNNPKVVKNLRKILSLLFVSMIVFSNTSQPLIKVSAMEETENVGEDTTVENSNNVSEETQPNIEEETEVAEAEEVEETTPQKQQPVESDNPTYNQATASAMRSGARVVAPALPVATEVVYTEASTAYVETVSDFTTAINTASISRIVLKNDITFPVTGQTIYQLDRSLQIDGTEAQYKMITNGAANLNDYSFIRTRTTTGSTLHLKNIDVYSGGRNWIDDENTGAYSRNWHIILDNVKFAHKDENGGKQTQRVTRSRFATIFMRNKVTMYTNAENFYVGQIAVEPNADVYGEINYYDFSVWWFVDAAAQGSANIGEGARVELIGQNGPTYPAIYQHYREINVHKNATYISRKSGNAIAYHTTAGVSDKYVNVFEGATIDATSTGTGQYPIVEANNIVRGHFYAAPTSKVLLIGQSNNDTNALVNMNISGSTFELDQPERYDIRNNRKTGLAMKVGTNANFIITNSDIEVWKKGSGVNLDANPTHSWFLSNVVADSAGNPLTGSDASMMGVWKTPDYARITGINTNPVFSFAEVTDADKNFTVNTTVLGEPSWKNQNYVRVANNENATVYEGWNEADGTFKFTTTNFFAAGAVLTTNGYRGVEAWPTLEDVTIVVKDVTPPTPITFTEANLYAGTYEIAGSSDEPGSIVTVTINGQEITPVNGTVIVDQVGKWVVELEDMLLKDQVVQVFLTDQAGNKNPVTQTPYRDAIFPAATKTTVLGAKPTMVVNPEIVELALNAQAPDLKAGVLAEDLEDGNITNRVITTGTVNTAVRGVYPINYTVKDLDGNEVVGKRTYIIGAQIVGTEYAIFANDFSTRVSEVDTEDTMILGRSDAAAIKLSDGSAGTVIVHDKTAYTNAVGAHPIELSVAEEVALLTTITATVETGNAPVLMVTPERIELPLNAPAPNVLTGVSATDVEDTDINGNISSTGTVDTTTRGVYQVNYEVFDADGNTDTGSRVYIVGAKVVGIDYAIFADDFTKRVSEVNTESDAVVAAANAEAISLTGGANGTVTVSNLGGYEAVVGSYQIEFSVAEETALKTTVTATVETGNLPELTVSPAQVELALDATLPNLMLGVIATDVEDGNLINEVQTAGTVDTATRGVYIITYSVIDKDGNEATAQRRYIVGAKIVGTKYAIFADDFTKYISEVDTADAAIINAANAEALSLEDGSKAGITVTKNGGYEAVAGTYTIEFAAIEETATKTTITAEVIAGNAPVLTVDPQRIELALNQEVPALTTGVSAIDTEDGDISEHVSSQGAVDSTTRGVYPVTYSVTDKDGNIATGTRLYIVDAKIVGAEYAVFADDFTKYISEVSLDASEIMGAANATAIKLTDGLEADLAIVTLDGYGPTAGTYNITFSVVNEPATKATITATVIAGNNPVLTVTPERVELMLNAEAPVLLEGVIAEDDEDGTLTTFITTVGTVDTTTRGVYNISYRVADSDGNIATAKRTYIVGAQIVGTEYAIFADNFTKFISEVDTADSAVILAADAEAIKLSDNTAGKITVVNNGGYTAATGTYNIELSLEEEPALKTTVTAEVTAGNNPELRIYPETVQLALDAAIPNLSEGVSATDVEDGVITEKVITVGTVDTTTRGVYQVTYTVTDLDGNTVSGKRAYVVGAIIVGLDYAIFADNFTKYVSEVTGTADTDIISFAHAEAVKLSDGTTGTLVVKDNGGFAAVVDLYLIQFMVEEEPALTAHISGAVIGGNLPTLNVDPAIVELSLNAQAPELMLGVIAEDIEDGIITNNVTTTGTIDTATRGVYTVTYEVTDADNNTVTAKRTYIVGAKAYGAEYAIFADDFTKYISEVDAQDSAIITAANAEAMKLSDGTAGTVIVENNGGYNATVGNYPITFNVAQEVDVKANITAEVIAGNNPTLTVTPERVELALDAVAPNILDGASAEDIEDGNLTGEITTIGTVDPTTRGVYTITYHVVDKDGNVATNKRIYIVDAKKVGTDYAIFANDFTKYISEVNTSDEAIITAANAEVITLADGSKSGITVTNNGGYTDTVGTYTIEFSAENEISLNTTIIAEVVAGNAPVLTINPERVELALNATTPTVLTGVSAEDIEDGDLSAKVKATGTVDTATRGVYPIEYAVTDEDGNIATGTRLYIVGAKIVGIDYAIFADDFTRYISEVNTNNPAIINAANATAIKLSTGTAATIQVSDAGGYAATAGKYSINFNVGEEAALTTTITAEVVAGNMPTLTVNPERVELELGAVAPNVLAGVSAEDIEDGDMTEKIQTSGIVDVATRGVYHVTYSVTDLDGNTATGKRTYIVGAQIVGIDYAIFANDFTKYISEVDAADAVIITAADAIAINLNDGLEGTISIANNGGYAAIADTYAIEFTVAEETTLKTAIEATVIAGNAPVLTVNPNRVELALNATLPDLMSGIIATDIEDGNITEHVTTTGTVDTTTRGVYTVEYTVTDLDGNIATGTRTYIVGAQIVGTEYAIFADDFTKYISEVDTESSAIIIAANAEAIKLTDGTVGKVIISNKDNYAAVSGTYQIELSVAEETTLKTTITATVIAGNTPVLTVNPNRVELTLNATQPDLMLGVDAQDTEDGNITEHIITAGSVDTTTRGVYNINYTITDADGNTNTGVRTYIVGAQIVGTEYAIFANDFTKYISQVNTGDAAIIESADAEAIKLSNATPGTIAIVSNDGYAAIAGTYDITFTVVEEQATKATITAEVIAGNQPTLTVTPERIEVSLDAPALVLLDGVDAQDTEDGDLTANIITTGAVDTAVRGVYHVQYKVADKDGNIATGIRVYVVGAQVVGNNYAIFANDFTKYISEVDTTDTAVLLAANAKAIHLLAGSEGTLLITANGGYTAAVGTYDIVLEVQEETGLATGIKAAVIAGNAPELTVSTPVELLVGDTFTTLDGVNAIDIEDGDLTAEVVVDKTIDTTVPGIHTLKYTVKDADQNEVEATRVVVVNDGSFVVTESYIIRAFNFVKKVDQVTGTDDEILGYTKANAWDAKTGELADVIVENKGNYQALEGTYTITLAVKDDKDVTKEIIATVNDKDVIIEGINYSIGANNIKMNVEQAKILVADTMLHDKLIDLTAVEVWALITGLPAGEPIVEAHTLVGAQGNYTVTFNVAEEVGTKVTVTITVTPMAPVVNPVRPGTGSEISGTGTPGNKIVVTLPDGTVVETTVNEDGSWSVISPVELHTGEEVSVIDVDPNGNESDATPAIVTPLPPTVNPVRPGIDSEISGTGTPGNEIVVILPDGTEVTTTVEEDGSWTITSPVELKPGEEVTATEKDKDGNISEPKTSIVTPLPPTVNPVRPGTDSEISGTGTPGNEIIVILPDGTEVTTTVEEDGSWTITSPVELKPGEEVTATEKDKDGNTSEPGTSIVTPLPPTVSPVYPGTNSEICGTGTAGNTIIITLPSGEVLEIVVDESGEWCATSPVELKPGEEVTATEKDKDGNISEPGTSIVTPLPPTVNPVHPGTNPEICGTGTAGNTIIITLPNGQTVEVVVDETGSWCTTSPVELKPGEEVTAVEKDKDGNTSELETSTVTPLPPTVNPVHPGTNPEICGTGTAGNTINITLPSGEVLEIVVDESGVWCATSPVELKPGEEITATEKDKDGNISEPGTSIVTPLPPTVNPVHPGPNPEICGTGTAGNTIIITLPNGEKVEVVVDETGSWCTTSPVELRPGEEVTAVEKDKDGNTSELETSTVTPLPPTVNPVHPGINPEICGTGTPGSTIVITLPNGQTVEVVVDETGSWCTTSPVELKPGEEVAAVEKDKDGNISEPGTSIITPLPPTVKPIEPGTNPEICGTGTPGNTIVITLPNGETVEVVVDETGLWCTTSPVELKPGEEVTVIEKDKDGNTSEPSKEIVLTPDYLADFAIDAENITMTLDELNKQINSNNLENYLTEATGARAYRVSTNKTMTPLVVDDAALRNPNLGNTTQTIEFVYTVTSADVKPSATDSSQNRMNASEEVTTIGAITKTVDVYIKNNTTKLPVTGENSMEMIFVSLAVLIASLFAIIFTRKKHQLDK